MQNFDLDILEKWSADPSFVNWANGVNATDVSKWDAYFAAHPELVELGEMGKFAILQLNVQPTIVDKERSHEALDRLHETIALQGKVKPSAKPSSTYSFMRIAAAIALLVGLGYIGSQTLCNAGSETIVLMAEDEIKDVLLADGTSIVLNKHASLTYDASDVRNVNLEGEAFFHVAKQPGDNAPFTVTTKDLVVKVLGTQFNVKADAAQTSVYLDEGKVQLALHESQLDPIDMLPGHLVQYAKNQNKAVETKKVDALENIAWKEKVILFEESTLAEVLKVVSAVYDVKFEDRATMNSNQTFTGGIPVQDLNITLEILRDIFKLEIKKLEANYLIEIN